MNEEKQTNQTIGILSMQRVVNFGSVLQAYCLRELIREVTGAQVSFVDIQDQPSLPSRQTVKKTADYDTPADYPPGLLQRGKRWCIARLSAYNKKLIRRFMTGELGLEKPPANDGYDCVVVGSDEVFNHRKGVCLQLHGQVEQGRKVITYAASCGSALASDIAPEDREQVGRAMEHFSAISVRDRGTQDYVAALVQKETQRHLDPVLVGNLQERTPKPVKLRNYLLVYAYGQRIRTAREIQAIRTFAKARGLKTVAMGGSQFWCDLYMPASPMALLDYFYHADYVLTDTFHGVIFSVINRKKFAAILRPTNANKLAGLLEDLGLQDRQLTDMDRLETLLPTPIDYDAVEALLERERIRTKTYLKNQLEG